MSAHPLDERWSRRAACRGPESALFFPPLVSEGRPERDAREVMAKAICMSCDVRRECLDHALRVPEAHGIWGGLSEIERARLLEERQDR